MQKISDRIGLIIENEQISTRSFEVRIGASNGLIGKCLLKGTDISSIWLSKIIEEFPKYNPGWLLTGKGDMLINESGNSPKKLTLLNDSDYCRLCDEKDKRIKVLEALIEMKEEKINLLKSQTA